MRRSIDDLPLTIIRQEANLGYGGNQKVGYEWAIERGLDIVVLLHGDGQYAPELLPDIVAPLEKDTWFASGGPNYVADIAQMDTDEYLCVWVENTAGDSTNIVALPNGWDDVRASVRGAP